MTTLAPMRLTEKPKVYLEFDDIPEERWGVCTVRENHRARASGSSTFPTWDHAMAEALWQAAHPDDYPPHNCPHCGSLCRTLHPDPEFVVCEGCCETLYRHELVREKETT